MFKTLVVLSSLIVSACTMNHSKILPVKENMWDPFIYKEKIIWDRLPFEGCLKKSCRIENNPGGLVLDFVEAARKIPVTNTVVLSGDCASACTGLADMIRDHVCIVHNILFMFHADSENTIPSYYSDWTLKWITDKGGLPTNESGEFLMMGYEEAKTHWRTCTTKEIEMIH